MYNFAVFVEFFLVFLMHLHFHKAFMKYSHYHAIGLLRKGNIEEKSRENTDAYTNE